MDCMQSRFSRRNWTLCNHYIWFLHWQSPANSGNTAEISILICPRCVPYVLSSSLTELVCGSAYCVSNIPALGCVSHLLHIIACEINWFNSQHSHLSSYTTQGQRKKDLFKETVWWWVHVEYLNRNWGIYESEALTWSVNLFHFIIWEMEVLWGSDL